MSRILGMYSAIPAVAHSTTGVADSAGVLDRAQARQVMARKTLNVNSPPVDAR